MGVQVTMSAGITASALFVGSLCVRVPSFGVDWAAVRGVRLTLWTPCPPWC